MIPMEHLPESRRESLSEQLYCGLSLEVVMRSFDCSRPTVLAALVVHGRCVAMTQRRMNDKFLFPKMEARPSFMYVRARV